MFYTHLSWQHRIILSNGDDDDGDGDNDDDDDDDDDDDFDFDFDKYSPKIITTTKC